MPVRDVVASLLRDPDFSHKISHVETLLPRAAVHAAGSLDLPENLAAFLETRGMTLFSHQAEALGRIRDGRHIVMTTPTASGKSLGFNLPIFERLIENPRATALYIYPTKALSNDQLKGLREIEGFTGLGTRAAVYDGDTPPGVRGRIREQSRIILTNPHELHQVLPWHHKWSGFFSHLNFVVLDEAHRYRGVFGSHIALLLRRLRRVCMFYGSAPQYILSTATLANPSEFAGKLTGLPCDPIEKDGSPAGTKYFILYNPFSDGSDGSTHSETKDLLLACTSHGLQTLCFTASRRMAELVTQWAREDGRRRGRGPGMEIATYRAGYLPEERRQIEQKLKQGSLSGVVSTNALELGIDVGSLDAVIISGYPGTAMATWQQAGRAGRRGGESLVILVAFENPLDQYFMRHPMEFFGRSCENAILDEKNPYILSGHLLCAASELPVNHSADVLLFGQEATGLLGSLKETGLLRETTRGLVYTGKARASDAVRLDATSSDIFRITCHGQLLETMDRAQAYREAHPGAVLLHQGETFLVSNWDSGERNIRVTPADIDYYTRAMKTVDLRVTGEAASRAAESSTLAFGSLLVTEQYNGYRVMRGDRIIATESLHLPPLTFDTKGAWFTVPESSGQLLATGGYDLAGGLHGAEHAMIGILPLHVMCDRRDIGGLSTICHPHTAEPTVFIYDGFEGGIGLSEKAFGLMPVIFHTTRILLESCPCTDGCPSCIYSPKCGNDNQPLDKLAAMKILQWLEGQWGKSIPGAIGGRKKACDGKIS